MLAGIAGAGILRRTLRPLHRVATLATHVSALPLKRGEVELAERVPAADTDPRTEVGQVGAALNRLLDHVGGALAVRQGQRDAGPLDHEPVDVTGLVLDTVSDASAAGPEHHWRLDLPEEPIEIIGDRAGLHQVLANLLANARTHTPPGSTVTANLSTRTPGQIVLAVLDDGPGIATELIPHVFERFARGDSSRARGTTTKGSTGLGLAIVQAIVSAPGGNVDLTSRPGQTCFLVRLPTGTADAGSRARPAAVR